MRGQDRGADPAKKPVRFALAPPLVVVALAALGAPAGAAPTYGPSGATFSVAFPKSPHSQTNTKAVLAGFPSGTVSTATAYWVSPSADPLQATTAPVPTFLVVVGTAKSPKKATTFASTVHTLSGAVAVTVNGAKGYRFSGTEEKVEGSSSSRNPNATEGIEFLAHGKTIYAVEVTDNSAATANSFLQSFKPA